MASIDQLSSLSAAALARRLHAGELDPVEAAEFYLGRIEAAAESNVFLTVTRERALAEARASSKRIEEGRPASPLDGVPLAWKDLFDMAGTPTTAASALFRDSPAKEQDAPAVANAQAAGMVSLGKVNLSEFAYSGLGLNPHFGTPANPHDPETPRAPGGSSSGSAVAVAMGLAPCAIGSDTGGSVRIPAAFNGVVGYKSSEGRIDKRGVFPLSPTLDTVGPLARTVEDCVLLDMALRGAPATGVRRAGVAGLRILVPGNLVHDGIEDAVAANFEAALAKLADAGAVVERHDLPLLDEVQEITAAHGSLTAAEAYHVHRARVDGPEVERIDRRVVARILGGKRMSAYDIIAIQEGRVALQARLEAELDGALIAMPTTPHTAPEIAPLEADDALFHEINLKTLRNTMLGNFLDLCGLAIPSGRDGRGLPTSILINAPGGEDERLLSHGLEIERLIRD